MIAERHPRARAAVLAALGLAGAGIALYSLFGLDRHLDAEVHTPRGTFVTYASAAPALQRAVEEIDADTAPGTPILVRAGRRGPLLLRGPAARESR